MAGKNPYRNYAIEYILGRAGLTAADAGALISIAIAAAAEPPSDELGGDPVDSGLDLVVVTPDQLTADVDDWDGLGDAPFFLARLSSDASRRISGFVAPDGLRAGVLVNVDANNVVLGHEDAGSAASNRILCPDGADVTLGENVAVWIARDDVSDRWRVVGGTAGGAGPVSGEDLVPYYLGPGETFTVPENKQALFADTIELDADAVMQVDGELIEVDAYPAAPAATTPTGVRNQPVYPMPLLFGEQGEEGEPGPRGETGPRGAAGTGGGSSSASAGPYAMVGETDDGIDAAIAAVEARIADPRILVQEADGSPSGLVDGLVLPNDSVSLIGGKAVVRQVPYGFIGAKAYHNTTQGGAAGVRSLNSEEYDTDGFHSTVTNNSRMTIPAGLGGKYYVRGYVWYSSANVIIRVLKNGSTVVGSNVIAPAGECVTILNLAPGDYVEVYTDTTGTTGHASAVEAMNSLEIVKLDAGRVGSGIGASAWASGTTNMGNAAFTVVALASQTIDTDGFHSTVTNTSRLTCPAGLGGKYLVVANLEWDSNTSGERIATIYKNGGDPPGSIAWMRHGANTSMAENISVVVDLVPGDYIELAGYQTSGGTRTAGGNGRTYLQMFRLDSGGSGHLDNLTATTVPAVTDDATKGYAPGAIWIDNTNDQSYVMADATAGAAVWRKVPTRTAYRDVAVTSGGTATLGDDSTIARIGAALIFNMDGNDGGCFVQWYREGSFNTVVGTSFGGSSFEMRGSTFSAGSAAFSIFLASNSAGAALQVKDNAGFGRTLRILEFAKAGNLT